MITDPEINSKQRAQQAIFAQLEENIPFTDAKELGELVHFQNSDQTPIQRWFSYREGYSVDLVGGFLRELGITGLVFDPFSGSGTTLLAARQAGLRAVGVDVNPISVMVARAENEFYDAEDIATLKNEIRRLGLLHRSADTYSTAFGLAGKVFNQEILQSLLQIREHIATIANEKINRLFFVTWLSVIESVSNVKKEGNGIKYKNRKRTKQGYITIDKREWEDASFPADRFGFVREKIVSLLKVILNDIEHNYGNTDHLPVVYEGSCLQFDQMFSDPVELTFFSPPYCNCFDYFEIHKVDLWLGGFVADKEEFRRLRNTGFRSNTNSVAGKSIQYVNDHLEALLTLVDVPKLWSPKVPDVIRGYFDDTNTLLRKIYAQTVDGGFVGIVVGNSAYTGVIIPVDLLIAAIAREAGFTVKNIYITRHLTTSSQQKKELEGLKYYLRESIVLLEK